ncbi:MAG: hypothetical protein FWE35_04600 [Streptosporangiales bacterium]|jgi:hypothetical protein|nr:hypothetical protein [Streptosporangiales bacterium]
MRVLPSVVIAVSGLSLLGIAGCSQFDQSLGQQQAVVSFQSGASTAVRMQVRNACGKLPNVSPAPLAKNVPLSQALNQVTFQINKADPADISRLQECLEKHKGYAGVDITDSSDNG